MSRPQERDQRHTVDQIVDAVPVLPTLDAPVPQMVEQVVDVLQFVDALVPVAEQVIEVPKMIFENIPSRRSVLEPQLAEQLVDVPTPSLALVPVSRMEGKAADRASHRPPTPSGPPSHRGTPPGQGGTEILALIQDVRVLLCRDSVPRQSAGHSSCATEGDSTVQYLNKVVDAWWCTTGVESWGARIFRALDDEEFFVVESFLGWHSQVTCQM